MATPWPGLEIERKFLVATDSWRENCQGKRLIRQSYLPYAPGVSMRVRRMDDEAILSFKSDLAEGVRSEWEVPIPKEMADWLFSFCPYPPIEKIRHLVSVESHVWEVDQFLGRHEGLMLAEIELSHPKESFPMPKWVGEEVTSDRRYRNSQLYRLDKAKLAVHPPHPQPQPPRKNNPPRKKS
ncbi:MAG: CYTH domain-containing protein [Alphaproteobacteria bacterium]|nr:CYTH domain-containing protein [Alphaproteobacteria bacterium]